MGGIVIDVNGGVLFGGHADDVANFFIMEGIGNVQKGDDHNGRIIINLDRRSITFDTAYFKITDTTILFWKSLGFRVLARR